MENCGKRTMLTMTKPATSDRLPVRHDLLPAETNFYSAYNWCLDPHLTVDEAMEHLAGEIDRLPSTLRGWQTHEVTTNVFLLSCSLLNGIDEYLRGHTLRLPAQLAKTRPGRIAVWVTEKVAESLPKQNRTQVCRWKEEWQNGLDGFFAVLARCDSDPVSFVESAQKLSAMLQSPLPSDLLDLRLGVPSAFSRLDLTHFDVLALGRRFMRQYPDRSHPILLLGLRTAGTYFSALLRSFFKAEGYLRVASLTVQPKKGPSRRERKALTSYAKQGFTLVIVDDPPHTGDTIVLAVDIAHQAGFDFARIKALVPTHPATRNWANTLPDRLVITLEPEEWRKQELLDPKNVEKRLTEYFTRQGFSDVQMVGSRRAEELDEALQNGSNRKRGATLKRIFEVQLRTPQGKNETRYVLAKSVGLGYLGYQAFLASHRLSDFVPPVLGLRNGILYTEWLPQKPGAGDVRSNCDSWIDTTAAYVAARTRLLSLPKGRGPDKAVHENGLELLAESFGRAYGRFVLDIPMRSWIQQRLYRLQCPFPTLIDGNMGHAEWIEGKFGPLKTGYYGHGLGKTQLNAIDPAYDLAETILSFALSPEEEGRLIRRYIEYSGDAEVAQRLFVNKLLAGLWTMESAQELLFGVMQTGQRQQELHRRFLGAWDFLTVQTARFCGARCRPSRPAGWRPPLVVLDIDGVVDRRIFGYPCATAAAMEALSLLATHRCSVALNTARSAAEVREYCQAYGLAGGVAEHGAYLWDAVAQSGLCLVDKETMVQLDELREHLRRIPGVFLDDRHQYSIRAFTFEKQPRSLLLRLLNSIRSFSVGQGAPTPLPTLVLNHLITTLRLDRLSFHHTMIDTTIVAKDTDKGTGLTALRDRVSMPDAETIAVGDTEADLPMFRVATRSFAPAQISCRRQARLLGCAVSRHRYQRGLLDIVRTLVGCGPGGDPIERANESDSETLFLGLLRAADQTNVLSVIRALFDRATFRIFVR
jgi:hydroxymethylpyrimidine pyrophosphatase-like HAD family hydrolase